MRKALLAAVAVLMTSPVLATTLIENARGIQVGPDGKIDRFRGLVINDQGKVVQVLRGPAAPVMPFDRRIDAGGRTLLPGLIDAHGHVMALGFSALQLDLTGVRTLEEMQQRLKAYAAANPQARWILGRGWNQELWPDRKFPTAADIDAVVGDRPV